MKERPESVDDLLIQTVEPSRKLAFDGLERSGLV
jgi:hypothetical protein